MAKKYDAFDTQANVKAGCRDMHSPAGCRYDIRNKQICCPLLWGRFLPMRQLPWFDPKLHDVFRFQACCFKKLKIRATVLEGNAHGRARQSAQPQAKIRLLMRYSFMGMPCRCYCCSLQTVRTDKAR